MRGQQGTPWHKPGEEYEIGYTFTAGQLEQIWEHKKVTCIQGAGLVQQTVNSLVGCAQS